VNTVAWIVVVALVLLVAVGVVVVVVRRRARARRVSAPVASPEVTITAPPDAVAEAGTPAAPRAPPAEPLAEVPVELSVRLGAARSLFDRVRALRGRTTLSGDDLEQVEEALLRADVGTATTAAILERLEVAAKANALGVDGVTGALRRELLDVLGGTPTPLNATANGHVAVWLFVGVNGVGKTTTIGKLAAAKHKEGATVLLAAADTFRAAAADQLESWAQRAECDLVRADEGADPGAVVHDALHRAASKGISLVLADTAGRLHNKANLLEELKKVRRVADRDPGEVTEVLLVLDATTGQNAIAQAREFSQAVGVTGIVLTKLDGTARGGVVVAVQRELGIPVRLVGLGEKAEDLMAFDPVAFVDALLGD
jgi:fused signal recognition particle receptor